MWRTVGIVDDDGVVINEHFQATVRRGTIATKTRAPGCAARQLQNQSS
jgi:hypothetical protein